MATEPQEISKPLYRAVSERILSDIREGRYLDVLPPQEELTQVYNVGRSTIREALRRLDEQGIIQVKHGTSTKIISSEGVMTIQPGLESFVGVTRLIESSGYKAGTSSLEIRRTHATSFLFPAFSGRPIIVLERVRTADDVPVILSIDAFVDGDWRLDTLEEELKQGSLLSFLDREASPISYSDTTVRAQLPDAHVVEKLKLTGNEPVLVLDEVSHNAKGEVVNCSTDYYHPRHISFRVVRRSDA